VRHSRVGIACARGGSIERARAAPCERKFDVQTHDLQFQRIGLVGRVLMPVLLVGMSGFFATMAVLVAHDSELDCDGDGQCVHVERYPFGFVEQTPLLPVKNAEVALDPGGRAMALKLVLNHQDGSSSEYQGVGRLGDRAERVAKELNAYLMAPRRPQTFLLRTGSMPVAIFLAVLTVLGLFLLPSCFTKVRLHLSEGILRVTVGRWPARRREHRLAIAELKGFGVRVVVEPIKRVVFHNVEAVTAPGAWVDIGMSFHTEAGARQRADALNDWAGLRPST
jgi:hypothetical protein